MEIVKAIKVIGENIGKIIIEFIFFLLNITIWILLIPALIFCYIVNVILNGIVDANNIVKNILNNFKKYIEKQE